MNRYIQYYGLLFILGCSQGFALALPENVNYWQCTTHDNANKQWTVKNMYRKVALNFAFAACKKESQNPASCKASVDDCEGFNQGMSTKPAWRCTAIDREADYWRSNLYIHRDDAALAALAYCRQKSAVPFTCYLNVVTCVNLNDRE